MTLVFGIATEALAVNLGASGAIAAVLARTSCFLLGFWILYS